MIDAEKLKVFEQAIHEEIISIAVCLANNFAKLIYQSTAEKGYNNYVNCLTQMLDWSHEYYQRFYHEVHSTNLLVAWGNQKAQECLQSRKTDCMPAKL